MGVERKRLNWAILIPIVFFCFCLLFDYGKLVQTSDNLESIDILSVFNSNSFSVFAALVIGMAYKFFAISNEKKQEESGLSRGFMEKTIGLSIAYLFIYFFNVIFCNLVTTVFMSIASVTYILIFFRYMLADKRGIVIKYFVQEEGKKLDNEQPLDEGGD